MSGKSRKGKQPACKMQIFHCSCSTFLIKGEKYFFFFLESLSALNKGTLHTPLPIHISPEPEKPSFCFEQCLLRESLEKNSETGYPNNYLERQLTVVIPLVIPKPSQGLPQEGKGSFALRNLFLTRTHLNI